MEWDTLFHGSLSQDAWFQENKHLLTDKDGFAWRGNKLYVPESICQAILRCCHDNKTAGHFGFLKMFHLTRRQFWWPHMRRDVEAYVASCSTCAKTKPQPGKPLGLLQVVIHSLTLGMK